MEALVAATIRNLAVSLPLLRLLIPCTAFASMLSVLRVSRCAPNGCARIDRGRQCCEQLGPRGLQFGAMRLSESPEQRFSAARESQHHFAAIRDAARAPQQAFRFQAIHQLHGTVMLNQ